MWDKIWDKRVFECSDRDEGGRLSVSMTAWNVAGGVGAISASHRDNHHNTRGIWYVCDVSMRSFQRPDTLDPVPGAIVATLRTIDLAAGAEARYADQLPQLLDALREQARIESITA